MFKLRTNALRNRRCDEEPGVSSLLNHIFRALIRRLLDIYHDDDENAKPINDYSQWVIDVIAR